MEHYADVRHWLMQTAHRVLSEAEYNQIMAEVARLESAGARGEAVVVHILGELHERFFNAVKHILAPEE